MKKIMILTAMAALSACGGGRIYSDSEIQEICSKEKRSAEGPTGKASIGAGTRGTSVGLSISVSDKFLRGLDPDAVYATCVQKYKNQNSLNMKN